MFTKDGEDEGWHGAAPFLSTYAEMQNTPVLNLTGYHVLRSAASELL